MGDFKMNGQKRHPYALQKLYKLRLAEKKSGEMIKGLPRLTKPINKQDSHAHP